jgi:hypothetical protein
MFTHRARRIVLVLAGIILPSVLMAQAVPGARVRVMDGSRSSPLMVGELISLVGDTATILAADNLESAGTRSVWTVGGQRRLEVRTSQRGNAVLGGLAGGLAGLALGTVIASGASSDCGPSYSCIPTSAGIRGGVLLAGIVLGAVVGHAIKSESWRRSDPPFRVGVAPGSQGMVFSASITF